MAFTEEEIRAIVRTGRTVSRPRTGSPRRSIERRNRIGRAYFWRVLPLDRVPTDGEPRCEFDDLGVCPRLRGARPRPSSGTDSTTVGRPPRQRSGQVPHLPPAGRPLVAGDPTSRARLHDRRSAMSVTVYVRRGRTASTSWASTAHGRERSIAPPERPARIGRTARGADLTAQSAGAIQDLQRQLQRRTRQPYTPEEGFDRLSMSEQTTLYAVTHALTALPADGPEGRLGLGNGARSHRRPSNGSRDRTRDGEETQQFRICTSTLKPDTRDVPEEPRVLPRSQNTVYHVGYPDSYRQTGKEPNLQMSLSEDGLRADIDVDYLFSRSPRSLFNGHLTASNSYIRVGENPNAHRGRWADSSRGGRTRSAAYQSYPPRGRIRSSSIGPMRPPHRSPIGLQVRRPTGFEDAAQELLTDWLVRRQYRRRSKSSRREPTRV